MAEEVVRVRFVAVGHDQLESIFRSIPGRAARMGGALRGAGTAGARAGKQTAEAWSAAGRPMSETQRLAMRVARDQERTAKGQERAAKRAADAQVREAKRVENEKERVAKRSHREEVARQQRLLGTQRRALERHFVQQAQFAHRLDNARNSGKKTLIERASGAATRVGGSLVRGAMGLGAIGVAAGAAAVGGALREGIMLQDQARALSRQGGGKVDPSVLRKEIEQTALDVRGVKAADVGGAMGEFVTKTGDLDAARRFRKTFAEISLATGTAATDIGSAAADLFEKFDVKTVDEMGDALAILTVQGKKGSFELRDAASQFPKIAAAAKRFGLDRGVEGVATLGGLTQIAKRSTGSPEQAATAVEAMFRQLVAKSDDIGRLKVGGKGVNVFRDKGKTQARDVRDVLVETIAGAGGNLQTLQKIFDEQGIRAVSPLISTYNQAYQGATGTETERTAAAMKALREEIDAAINVEGASAEVARDLASAQGDASAQITAVWEQFRSGVTAGMMPAVQQVMAQLATVDFAALGAALGNLTVQVLRAGEALGLLPTKRTTGAEAGKAAVDARMNVLAAEQEKSAIQIQTSLRGTATAGGFVPGKLTAEEQARVKELDAQIAEGTAEAGRQDAIGASADRFHSVPLAEEGFFGPSPLEGSGGTAVPFAFKVANTQKATAGGLDAAAEQIGAAAGTAAEKLTGFESALQAITTAAQSAATELSKVQRPSIREPG